MNKMHRALSLLLALAMMIGFLPAAAPAAEASAAPAASTSTGTANGVTLTQTAEWDGDVPGETAVRVTLDVTSQMDLQSASDVVFLIDRSISQPLTDWKRDAKNLAGQLNVPGMRFALATYHSSAETPLAFTEDVTELNRAIDGIQPGYNCNCYAGLKEVQSLLESREDRTRPAYVVLFTNGRFNMNPDKMEVLARQLDAVAPIYYTRTNIRLGAGSALGKLQNIAATVGQSRTISDMTLQAGLADGFRLYAAVVSIDGRTSALPHTANGTYHLPAYQMGQSLRVKLFGKLVDTSQTGRISAAPEASVSGEGVSVTTGGVAVTRGNLAVTYDGNGHTSGDVPTDTGHYLPGTIVAVKPSNLRKDGWNFSGWVTNTGANVWNGNFTITQNTKLTAAWGRAYVKLSSGTTSSGIKGQQMLNCHDVIYTSSDLLFYHPMYWGDLSSLILEDNTQIPPDHVAKWDITDTTVPGNTPGAVMAWITNASDPSTGKYDLHIGGQGGVAAPEDSHSLFEGCSASTFIGLENLNVSKVTDMARMFRDCNKVTSLNIGNWKMSIVKDVSSMFSGCSSLTKLDISNWDTSSIEDMAALFSYCSKLAELDISRWDTSAVQDLNATFMGCTSLTTLNLKGWKTSNVTTVEQMFRGCTGLTELDLSTWETPRLNKTPSTFYDCTNLEKLNLSSWDMNNVELMSYMFYNCSALSKLPFGDNWDTRRATSMEGVFGGCKNLVISQLNLTTSNVSSMEGMFSGCSALQELTFGNKWDTSKTTNMTSMFSGCTNLQAVDVSTWNTSNAVKLSKMFSSCAALKQATFGDAWDTSKVTDMSSMFSNCSQLNTISFGSSWNTSRVENMSSMFSNCSVLQTLDLSLWDMSRVSNIGSMFYQDTNLTNIGKTRLDVKDGCVWTNWNKDVPALQTTEIWTLKDGVPEKIYPPAPDNTAALSDYQPEETPKDPGEDFRPEELPAEELPQEQEVLAAAAESASAPSGVETDVYGRPLYANEKEGLWNRGEVQAEDTIDYSLEVQYLTGNDVPSGISGDLAVTNPLPEGLTLIGTPVISGPMWIKEVPGSAAPAGRISKPLTVTGNVLSFTVTGLSAGAKFVVDYTCAVPAGASGRAFLNTASVDDGGIADYADPVLHTMDGVTMYDVTFAYTENAPAGAANPSTFAGKYPAGTAITLPSPAVPGYTFNGWTLGGAPYAGGSAYTVNNDTTFTGSWTKKEISMVPVNYVFTGDLPDNEDLIRGALLEGVPTEYPVNTTAMAPVLAKVPTGYRFQWLSPVGADGQFNVGSGPEITITGRWTKEKYSVTYQYDGSAPSGAPALPASSDHTWGIPVSLAQEPDHTETHLFLGWTAADDAGNSVDIDADGKFQMPMVPVTVTGTWAARPATAEQEVLIDPNGGVWNDSDEEQVLLLDDYSAQVAAGTFPDARKEGAVFVRWDVSDENGAFAKRVTAQWKTSEPPSPEGTDDLPVMPPVVPTQTVRYFVITAEAEEGGSIRPEGEISVPQGASRTFTVTPDAGYVILDVEVDGESVGTVASYDFRDVRRDHKIEARFAPASAPSEAGGVKWLNTSDHTAYLQGFPDGTFQPDGSMTRGEAAQMFYNLLLERTPAASAGFSDVPAGMWYEDAVNALSALGVMHGDGQGRFLPEQAITRAEFAAAAARFAGETAVSQERFTDVREGDWFFAPVMSAAALGWITGYDGGVFCPDIPIARSEAAAIVNRMLGRRADRAYADSRAGELRRFPDVTANHWAYYDILEASNGHDYYLDQGGAEIWRHLDGSYEKNT